ncbi:unnamed protein product [Nippostrongylus brasiliensis]|uniref:DM domain-containing protein n=1 Tax=Nippostrongylus brasiliensis TaxID=27835 RepID=A0A0N4XHS8_NIPBR|nr:unnamed protein product [Nippostrongylus brasiliensis]
MTPSTSDCSSFPSAYLVYHRSDGDGVKPLKADCAASKQKIPGFVCGRWQITMNANDATTLKKATGECHRFFGYGKKIPRDVKRHCGMCRQHGIVIETRGHLCQFRNCECGKCKLIRKRRSIMSTQIRLRREQDKRFQVSTGIP